MRELIGQRISALLVEKQISERQLSDAIGRSDSYINKVVNGKINISIGVLEQICAALHISPEEFLALPEADTTNKYLFLQEIESLTEDDIEQLRSIVQYMKKKNQQIRKRK